ncbi:tryptophan synthase subunit alpha [Candidatus Micrarchaeota archaeon]|nr:tryptophan synthase subunit alpha [Candidatus Micrarchaeota archaeon]
MNLREMFSSVKGAAFMPYICCGDPSQEFTVKLIKTLVANGADAIELGIPFSDPIADGPTIQAASNRALENGMNPMKAIEIMKKIRKEEINVPILPMTYYNILYSQGTEKFLKMLKDAEASGVVIPDVPLEESGELSRACKNTGLDLISFITPNSSKDRIKHIAKNASGFLYVVAVLGITGARAKVENQALELIKNASSMTKIPLVVGFGISKPDHAKAYIEAGAKGIIVGSQIMNIYSKYISKDGKGFEEAKALDEIAEFTKEMKKACVGK